MEGEIISRNTQSFSSSAEQFLRNHPGEEIGLAGLTDTLARGVGAKGLAQGHGGGGTLPIEPGLIAEPRALAGGHSLELFGEPAVMDIRAKGQFLG